MINLSLQQRTFQIFFWVDCIPFKWFFFNLNFWLIGNLEALISSPKTKSYSIAQHLFNCFQYWRRGTFQNKTDIFHPHKNITSCRWTDLGWKCYDKAYSFCFSMKICPNMYTRMWRKMLKKTWKCNSIWTHSVRFSAKRIAISI